MTPPMSRRIQPLQALAEEREDAAARRLAGSQRRLAERQTRLAELRRYREDYQQRGSEIDTPQLLLNRRAFIARLREAELFQQQLVEQAQRDCDNERARWLLSHRETATLEQLAEVYRQREAAVEEQREQRRMDEFALHRHRRAVHEGVP